MTLQDLKNEKATIISRYNEMGGLPEFLKNYMERMLTVVECGIYEDHNITTIEELISYCMSDSYRGVEQKKSSKISELMAEAHDHKHFDYKTKTWR